MRIIAGVMLVMGNIVLAGFLLIGLRRLRNIGRIMRSAFMVTGEVEKSPAETKGLPGQEMN